MALLPHVGNVVLLPATKGHALLKHLHTEQEATVDASSRLVFDADGFGKLVGGDGTETFVKDILNTTAAQRDGKDYFMHDGKTQVLANMQKRDYTQGVLLECFNGIKLWPVKMTLVDEGWEAFGNVQAITLYHYTHEQSFMSFVKLFGKTLEPHQLWSTIYHHLMVDVIDRCFKYSSFNPKGEPELCVLDPSRFESKKQMVMSGFGLKDLDAYSTQGHRHGKFADYCIAFKVPSTACIKVPTQQSADDESAATFMKISRAVLDDVQRRLLTKAATQRVHALQQQKTQEAIVKKKGWRLMSLFCGGREVDDLIDDMAMEHKKEQQAAAKKKDLDTPKKHAANEWVKEHFYSVQLRKDTQAHADGEKGTKGEDHDDPGSRRSSSSPKNLSSSPTLSPKSPKSPMIKVVDTYKPPTITTKFIAQQARKDMELYMNKGEKIEKQKDDELSKEVREMYFQFKLKEAHGKDVVSAADAKMKDRHAYRLQRRPPITEETVQESEKKGNKTSAEEHAKEPAKEPATTASNKSATEPSEELTKEPRKDAAKERRSSRGAKKSGRDPKSP